MNPFLFAAILWFSLGRNTPKKKKVHSERGCGSARFPTAHPRHPGVNPDAVAGTPSNVTAPQAQVISAVTVILWPCAEGANNGYDGG
jgi:hypothetical protein